MLLNGINVPTDRSDVLDRSFVVELERIPDGERRTEEELWERFEAQHPKLLGAVFDLLAKAMAHKPSTKLSRRPRLADWGEYAAASYAVMGWGAERFLADWNEIVCVQNQATLDGSPVAQAVIKFMEDKAEYSASSSELHKNLEVVAESLGVSIVRDKEWPKSARWLWRRTKEVLPLLVAAGIEASREEDNAGSRIMLRKLSKTNATDATEGKSGLLSRKPVELTPNLLPPLMPPVATPMSLMPLLMPPEKPIPIRISAAVATVATHLRVLGKAPPCGSTAATVEERREPFRCPEENVATPAPAKHRYTRGCD